MAEPVLAADGASRRWWDPTPKELNIVAFTLLFLITLPMLTKIFTSDFGTHIALGKHIVQKFDIPTREHWNYPSLGMENGSGGEWGFEAVLYLVHAATGEYGVSFLVWAVVFGIFLFLYRAMVLRGAHPLLAVLAIFAFSGFLRIRIQPRPEIFTYLFTAMTIFLLSEYYFGSRKKLIYLFPPMILVWANCHPTYLMAFGLYGAFFADALVRAAWGKEFQWARLRTWVIPPLVTGVAGLVLCGLNPHGYGWLLAPLHLISRGGGGGRECRQHPDVDLRIDPGEGDGILPVLQGRGRLRRGIALPGVGGAPCLPARPIPVRHRVQGRVGLGAGRVDDGPLPRPRGVAAPDRVPVGGGGLVFHQSDAQTGGAGREAETKGEKGASTGGGPLFGPIPVRVSPQAMLPSSASSSSPSSLLAERRWHSLLPNWSTEWESRSTNSPSRRRNSCGGIPSRARCSTSSTSAGSSTGSYTPGPSPSSTAARTTSRCSWNTRSFTGGDARVGEGSGQIRDHVLRPEVDGLLRNDPPDRADPCQRSRTGLWCSRTVCS